MSLTVERSFRVGAKQVRKPAAEPASGGRVPRVAKLMALAIRFDEMIREGVVVDQAELARVGHVSRARLTQIMNLLNLAPDIQEEILHMPDVERGGDPLTERKLRPIAAVADWRKQRRMYGRVADVRHRSFPAAVISTSVSSGPEVDATNGR